MQEDRKYVTIEPAPLKKQGFDFTPTKVIENTSVVMEEIKKSNASNGITTENIESIFHFGNKPKGVLERPIFNGTDVEGPKLPEIPRSNGGQYIGISAAGIAGGILGMLILGTTVGLGYLFWHRKNREGEYDLEKQSTYINYSAPEEKPFLLTKGTESKTLNTGQSEVKQSLPFLAVNPIPKLNSPSSSISGPSSSQTFNCNDLRK